MARSGFEPGRCRTKARGIPLDQQAAHGTSQFIRVVFKKMQTVHVLLLSDERY